MQQTEVPPATKYVMALAGRECLCIALEGKHTYATQHLACHSCWNTGIHLRCTACQGTGAEFPGLRQECPGVGDQWEDADYDMDGPDELDGTASWVNIGPVTITKDHPCTKDEACYAGCEGRGWLLISEAERLGVEVRIADSHGWSVMFHPNSWVVLHTAPEELGLVPVPETEGGLAKALCQALGQPVGGRDGNK